MRRFIAVLACLAAGLTAVRKLELALAITVLMATLSCGGDTAGPADEGADNTGPASATITPDGGTVTARQADGTRFKLVFPAGAVRTPTQVTVRPVSPSGSVYAQAALEPAGMVFFEPVDVIVTVPDGISLSNAQLMFRPDDAVYLATTVDTAARTLRTSIRFFGFTEDGSRSVPTAPPARAEAALASSGNQLGAGSVDCAAMVAAAQQSFDAYIGLHQFDDALECALNTGAALQTATCAAEAQAFLANAQVAACQGLKDALDTAANSTTSTLGEFRETVQPILEWFSNVQTYAPGCGEETRVGPQIASEANEFILFFNTRLGNLTGTDFATFQDLKEEAVSVFEMMTAAMTLGLVDVYDDLQTRAFFPAVDRMREVAYALCVSDHWHYPLSRMTSTGFFSARDIVGTTPPRPGVINPAPSQYADFLNEDIYEDMQFCATCIELKGLATSGGMLDSTSTGGGGAPGQKTATATITIPTRGKLEIGGEIWGFSCWEDLDADNELEILLGGKSVLTLRRPIGADNYFSAGPEDIDIEQAALAAGITPSEGSTHQLVIKRRRDHCDARLWGETEYTLVDATVNWKNPTIDMSLSFPDSVEEGENSTLEVHVQITDQFNVTTDAKDVDINLSVLGGSASQSIGRTGADGKFTTTVHATGTLVAPNGTAAAAGSMSINAEARTFEGVTASESHQTFVRICPAQGSQLRPGGKGTNTLDLDYGHIRSWSTAPADVYNYAAGEWNDAYSVLVDDPALDGQPGKVYAKLHYRFESTGISISNPGARVGIGPRNGFSSPYFWEQRFNTPGTQTVVEQDWEVPITCVFNRSSQVMQVYCDAFAKAGSEGSVTISAEITWMGISKVTTADGTPVPSYKICTGSGTDYTQALNAVVQAKQ